MVLIFESAFDWNFDQIKFSWWDGHLEAHFFMGGVNIVLVDFRNMGHISIGVVQIIERVGIPIFIRSPNSNIKVEMIESRCGCAW